MNVSRGKLEAQISEAVIKFEKEYMGRGPLQAKTYLFDDLVLVRLGGVLTPAEHQLTMADQKMEGRDLIKRMRATLIEKGRPLLEKSIETILEKKVISLHTDISTVSGERVMIFVLDSKLNLD